LAHSPDRIVRPRDRCRSRRAEQSATDRDNQPVDVDLR
jgi:hypothetical protein